MNRKSKILRIILGLLYSCKYYFVINAVILIHKVVDKIKEFELEQAKITLDTISDNNE